MNVLRLPQQNCNNRDAGRQAGRDSISWFWNNPSTKSFRNLAVLYYCMQLHFSISIKQQSPSRNGHQGFAASEARGWGGAFALEFGGLLGTLWKRRWRLLGSSWSCCFHIRSGDLVVGVVIRVQGSVQRGTAGLQAWLTSDFYCTPAQQNGYNQNHGCLHCTHCSLPSSLLLLLTPSNFTSLLLQSPSSYVEEEAPRPYWIRDVFLPRQGLCNNKPESSPFPLISDWHGRRGLLESSMLGNSHRATNPEISRSQEITDATKLDTWGRLSD